MKKLENKASKLMEIGRMGWSKDGDLNAFRALDRALGRNEMRSNMRGIEMVGMKPLRDFLELILWTGTITGERPVSAIVVAPPGAGKTSMLETLECPKSAFVSDLTSKTLHDLVKRFDNGAPCKLTHIILGDMLTMFGHKTKVVTLTCRLVSGLTGDSQFTDPFTGTSYPVKLGLITAIPTEDLNRYEVHREINSGGFASRFIMVRYSFSERTVDKIHDYIQMDRYLREKHTELVIAEDQILVEIPDHLAKQVRDLMEELKDDQMGTRLHHHLRTLVKAEARRNGRRIANQSDVESIREYSRFFSGPGRVL